MLTNEDGPFGMFDCLRKRVGVYLTDENDVPITFLGKLLRCVWCVSIWVAVGVALIVLTDWWVVLLPFALSAGAVLIEEAIDLSLIHI